MESHDETIDRDALCVCGRIYMKHFFYDRGSTQFYDKGSTQWYWHWREGIDCKKFVKKQLGVKRVMQKIVLYAHIDKEHLRHEGEALGIKDDALTNFMHFTEIKLSADVDTRTGKISNVKVV
jgi:hypothetical protein